MSPAPVHGKPDTTRKMPKLPPFMDGKDELDSYLQRFERFARSCKWKEEECATLLSALLTGRALEVYSRMSEATALDYSQLKNAVLRRYDFTCDGYCNKFKKSKPQMNESPERFMVRLTNYLDKWIALSDTPETFGGLRELAIKEQFINACPMDLKEQVLSTLDELVKVAERFLIAHHKQLAGQVKPRVQNSDESSITNQE